MTKTLFALAAAAVVLTTGCAKDESQQPVQVSVSENGLHERFFYITSVLWPNPGNIPVCFEDAGFETQKGWVKDAIHKSWEANDAAIKFTGWGQCTAGAPGIHIKNNGNDPDGPHSNFGTESDGVTSGMVLDFNMIGQGFENCHTSQAMLERCNRAVATHEFGHALGFLHEHERQDTPQSCEFADPQPTDGEEKTIGSWDLMSIMNYCYPDRDNVYPTVLSPNDIKGLVAVYPPPKVTTPPATTTPATTTPDATTPKTQSTDTGDVDTSEDDDTDMVEIGDDDATPAKKSSSKKKKKSSSSTSDRASSPVASAGCSAAPSGAASSPASLLCLAGLGLVLAARKRRQQA